MTAEKEKITTKLYQSANCKIKEREVIALFSADNSEQYRAICRRTDCFYLPVFALCMCVNVFVFCQLRLSVLLLKEEE